jgi:hypothetical protein
LLNKDKNIIDSTLSGKDGEFKFKYIPYSDQFYFKIKDTSVINSYKSIIIYDKNGSIVKYVTIKNKELFEYKLLQNDLNMLQEIYLHDPWMNLSYQVSKNNPKAPILIMENIYFESGKADILQASKQTLDKIVFTLKNNPTIKIEIGAAIEDLETPPDDYSVQGRDLLTGKPKQVVVSYREIAKALDKSIQRIEDAVMETLSQTPPELAADIYNTGIYLAGGGSMLRGLDKRISQKTDLPVYIAEDPLRAVVRGTGMALKEIPRFRSILIK